MALYNYAAKVEHIVDGDTIDLTCDLGFRIYHKARFRLYGIDTPEQKSLLETSIAPQYEIVWFETLGERGRSELPV